jgi:hypothetical protein
MKTVVVILGVLGALLAGAGGLFAVAFYYGLGLDKKDPDIDFHGPEMTAAREGAKARLTQELDALAARVAPFAHRVGDVGRSDRCRRGQYNWKIKDPIAVRCSITLTQVFTFSGEFLPQAQRFVDAFCPDSPGLNAGAAGLKMYEHRLGQTFRNFPDGYTIDDITPSPIGCADNPASRERFWVQAWMTLPIRETHRRSHAAKLPRPCSGSAYETPCDNHPLDLEVVVAQAPAEDRWAVVVSVSEHYWHAGWK